MAQAALDFTAATATTSWVNLPRVLRGNPDRIIAGTLTKKNLMALYSEYMVGASGTPRKIYDDLLLTPGGLCPFCGGLGQVHTLDHYLPKANFPIYSVSPANLVPCCRDCNTGKGTSIGTQLCEQTLHPYLDDDKFFTDRWIYARASRTDPIVVTFSCSPPANWGLLDRQRAHQHFVTYGLAYRFALQSGAETARVVGLRSNSLKRLTNADFSEYLLESAGSAGFDLNGWNRTLYAALANTPWFCHADFNDPCWHLD